MASIRKLCALSAAVLLLVAIGGVLGCGGNAGDPGTAAPTANTTPSVSLAGYAEAAEGQDLAVVRNAKFVSLMLSAGGGLQTFMVAAGEPEFVDLADAVAKAKPVKETAADDGSSLVFVLKDGTMVSFALDRKGVLLARGGRAWRPAEGFAETLAAVEGRDP